ncbi:4Fe-4S ferredoxin [Clostridium carboxidivorans P7]|uniref:4Fe-4S ferredoxin iron-sulfur binding domain protein n=1 Tax=Clostridium carboxidivorans P7 TaxID=536227 RepID=C6PYZ8_9CLOT|nr:EFR1 family ferrodoxin [Clostridium carboxidivorans]AKN31331.1 4Fe-4S ferredoxin [Clostridium carboxidivorans P7]EET85532.1 4Fe-4S ferredoxin iron-sulfur binding domain protein [Clostridium carboxidivorans P7]EFG88462.1 4Fe-4S binding domain protein [Clostridium carboxidivorans P7]
MLISSVTTIYFSPTGTTKKIINSIVKGMGIVNNKIINLTLPKVREAGVPLINGDIVIIGVPVYEERIPKIVYPFLVSLKGNGNPVVLVGVYGNIGDGIVLNELDFIAKKSGLKVVAAGSFIGEHSFSTEEMPIAQNRPNNDDLNRAEEFGKNIMKKIQNIDSLKDISLKIPQGKLPLMAKIVPKNSARLFTKTPFVDMSKCSHCNVCAKLCPMSAIDKETLKIDEEQCLRCFCCVKRCPKKARKIIYKPKFLVSKILTIKNRIIKEPKLYL